MIGGTKAIRTLVAVATIISSLALPAYSQGLNKRPGSGGYEGPPVEKKPKIDEKAYKAALERIPEPDKKFDPWELRARPRLPRARRNRTRDACRRRRGHPRARRRTFDVVDRGCDAVASGARDLCIANSDVPPQMIEVADFFVGRSRC